MGCIGMRLVVYTRHVVGGHDRPNNITRRVGLHCSGGTPNNPSCRQSVRLVLVERFMGTAKQKTKFKDCRRVALTF